MNPLNHLQEIKQVINELTQHGHIDTFELISCAGAIEFELDQMAEIWRQENENGTDSHR